MLCIVLCRIFSRLGLIRSGVSYWAQLSFWCLEICVKFVYIAHCCTASASHLLPPAHAHAHAHTNTLSLSLSLSLPFHSSFSLSAPLWFTTAFAGPKVRFKGRKIQLLTLSVTYTPSSSPPTTPPSHTHTHTHIHTHTHTHNLARIRRTLHARAQCTYQFFLMHFFLGGEERESWLSRGRIALGRLR